MSCVLHDGTVHILTYNWTVPTNTSRDYINICHLSFALPLHLFLAMKFTSLIHISFTLRRLEVLACQLAFLDTNLSFLAT